MGFVAACTGCGGRLEGDGRGDRDTAHRYRNATYTAYGYRGIVSATVFFFLLAVLT